MKAWTLSLAVLALSATLTGCGVVSQRQAVDDELQRAEIARAVSESAKRVAVSKPGAKVCRQLRVGISELDWVRGTVSAVDSTRIRIRIDDSGRFAHVLEGVPITRGVHIWEAQVDWTPCG